LKPSRRARIAAAPVKDRRSAWRRERGQTTAEYVGLMLIIAAAMALVVASPLGDTVIAKVDCAIEGILADGGGCAGGASEASDAGSGAPPIRRWRLRAGRVGRPRGIAAGPANTGPANTGGRRLRPSRALLPRSSRRSTVCVLRRHRGSERKPRADSPTQEHGGRSEGKRRRAQQGRAAAA